jgi:hypothetical protein
MRKHKSVVAILLAVMMIFTFMPTMAFANVTPTGGTGNYTFSDDLSEILDSSGNRVVGTVKVWTSDGRVKVKANSAEVGDVTVPDVVFEYYDLTGSEFIYHGTNAIAASYNSLAVSDIDSLKLKKPAGVEKETETVKDTKIVSLSAIQDYVGYTTHQEWQRIGNHWQQVTVTDYFWDAQVKLNGKSDDIAQKDEDQPVEITLDQTWNVGNNKKVTGAPAAANTKVNAKKPVAGDAKFYFDEVSDTATQLSTTANTNPVYYDGAEHVIVMKPMAGFDVSYTIFNKKTGNEDPVDKVVVKDVLAEGMTVTATVKDTATAGKTSKQTFTFKGVNAVNPGKPSFAWAAATDKPYKIADNTQYDPYDYIVINAATGTSADWTDARKDASKAAVEANKDLLNDFFKTYYGITATPEAVKNAAGNTVVKFVVGKYTVKKAKDVDPRFETMLRNFGFDPTSDTSVDDGFTVPGDTQIELVPAEDFFEIEFVNTPTSKVYKKSKTTKKGALKKDQSFTVKAEATNGDAVSYKLIDAPAKIVIDKNTGKITCKKGLKGTHKIKVKAYVAKSYKWSGGYPSETQAITIKIKK